MILNENGGVKDDIIVYKIGNGNFMVIVNAGNLGKDWDWFNKHKIDNVKLENISADICLLAVQGPKSCEIVQSISETKIDNIKYFTISELKLKNITAKFCRIARTGYTGEDGFEIFISKEAAKQLWEFLMELSVKPCGLGCRDTLRLESCMPLYGHEIDETINPIEAGFQKTINWNNDFIGKSALLSVKDRPFRKTVAFECLSGIPRNGSEIFTGSKKTGFVTSGTFSPTLKRSICLTLIEADAEVENLEVRLHNTGRKLKAVSKPFYKKIK
jgi:aminomethyltransferase